MEIEGTRPNGINVSFLFERKTSSIYDHVEPLTVRIMQNNGITRHKLFMVIIMMCQVTKHLGFIQEVAAFTGCLPKVYLHFVSQKLIRKRPLTNDCISFKPNTSLHMTEIVFGQLPAFKQAI